MIYGVDVDGVLSQTTEAVIDYLRDIHDYDLRLDQVTSFRWEYWCPDRWIVDEVIELFGSEIFYQGLVPIVSAVEGVRALRSRARTVVAITSRPSHCKETTEDWLMAWGFDGVHRVICTSDKVAAAKHHDVTLMVEDTSHHALALAGHDVRVHLLDYPWNQDVTHPFVRRVRNWAEIIEAERHSWHIDAARTTGMASGSVIIGADPRIR